MNGNKSGNYLDRVAAQASGQDLGQSNDYNRAMGQSQQAAYSPRNDLSRTVAEILERSRRIRQRTSDLLNRLAWQEPANLAKPQDVPDSFRTMDQLGYVIDALARIEETLAQFELLVGGEGPA